MVSRWAKQPNCYECGKRKGPNQRNDMRCFRCAKIAKRRSSEKAHETHIMYKYGLTLKLYRLLLSFQGGKCAICRRATGRTKRLAVDHDHSCDRGHDPRNGCLVCIRGLLCSTCNTFLGRMRDDPEVGERFAAYLRMPPFRQLMKEATNADAA